MILEILVTLFALMFILLANSIFTINQQDLGIIERFGKFNKIAKPGLNVKLPIIDNLKGKLSLRIHQLDVAVETKTLDNVFVNIVASVQYRIIEDKAYEAFYTLDDPSVQIQAFVFDVIRAQVPHINLDDVFSRKNDIADSVKHELAQVMENFGYDFIKALITDIRPDVNVKKAMNEINEAHRLRIAAMERAEAEKIMKIKQAEGESESKILQGKGIAGQRHEIMTGLKESLNAFQEQLGDNSAHDAMTLLMMAQYFDTIKDLGMHSKQTTILIPHSPAGMQDLFNQLRNTIITAAETSKSNS